VQPAHPAAHRRCASLPHLRIDFNLALRSASCGLMGAPSSQRCSCWTVTSCRTVGARGRRCDRGRSVMVGSLPTRSTVAGRERVRASGSRPAPVPSLPANARLFRAPHAWSDAFQESRSPFFIATISVVLASLLLTCRRAQVFTRVAGGRLWAFGPAQAAPAKLSRVTLCTRSLRHAAGPPRRPLFSAGLSLLSILVREQTSTSKRRPA
jgi:hypothetical protein